MALPRPGRLYREEPQHAQSEKCTICTRVCNSRFLLDCLYFVFVARDLGPSYNSHCFCCTQFPAHKATHRRAPHLSQNDPCVQASCGATENPSKPRSCCHCRPSMQGGAEGARVPLLLANIRWRPLHPASANGSVAGDDIGTPHPITGHTSPTTRAPASGATQHLEWKLPLFWRYAHHLHQLMI